MSDPILSIRRLRKQYGTGVEALKAVDLDALADLPAGYLSAGQRRRAVGDQPCHVTARRAVPFVAAGKEQGGVVLIDQRAGGIGVTALPCTVVVVQRRRRVVASVPGWTRSC